jgi:hypothetical protein
MVPQDRRLTITVENAAEHSGANPFARQIFLKSKPLAIGAWLGCDYGRRPKATITKALNHSPMKLSRIIAGELSFLP